jgi:hypothetical protein
LNIGFPALSGWLAAPVRHGSLLGMTISPNPYRSFRFPAEIIEHAIWLYQCCSLSLREVELIQAARGVVVSCESIREWGLRLGRLFANAPKRRRPRPGDKWFLDGTVNLIGRKRNEMSWPSGLPTRCASAWKKLRLKLGAGSRRFTLVR